MINVGLFIKKDEVFDGGINEESINTKILDTTKTWVTNQWKDYTIRIIEGTGQGYYFKCTNSGSSNLNFDALTFNLDTTSVYEIYTQTSNRVELFHDEKISITSSIQNSNDIGKLFTDYSQSFTIPASKHNNAIFSHWYESDVDNGYDHRKRYDAYIELDTMTFKVGNVQLEKANKKNGYIESYSVTFYGNLTQLKDKFKDIKLRDLVSSNGVNWWSILNHNYSSSEVIDRITSNVNNNQVCYPLIGSQKKYYYKNGIANQDITLDSSPIIWNELFPAVPMSLALGFVEQCFGLKFIGTFFSLDQWTKLYLYLKNAEVFKPSTPPSVMTYDVDDYGNFTQLNLSTGIVTLDYSVPNNYRHITMDVYVNPIGYETIPYTVTVYRNNVEIRSFNGLGSGGFQLDDINVVDYNSTIQKYYCTISATSYFEYLSALEMQIATTSFGEINYRAHANLKTITSTLHIQNYVPDIKISDFVTGIIKAFNLIVIPTDIDTFEFIPLEQYYNSGKITDITKYCNSNDADIERPKLYKSINFQYEKSTNILNNAYFGLYGKEYGDLIYSALNSNESSNYDIKLPFENVLFERTVDENFETASIIDKDLKPYTPKPMLIYLNDLQLVDGSNPIKITTETSINAFSFYNRFSNEYNSLPTDTSLSALMTMNFNNEQSPWYNVIAPKGLYYRHYSNYINNIYNIKSRNIKIKAILPPSLLSKEYGILLNDRLIISGKRYLINSFTTDLTTGETNFDLLTDYRNIDARSTVGYRFANYSQVQTDKTAQTIKVIIYKNDYDSFGIKGAENYLDYTTSINNDTDLELIVNIPYNSGADRTDKIGIEYIRNGIIEVMEYITFLQTAI